MKHILYKHYSPSALEEDKIMTLIDKQFWFGGNKIQNDPYDLLGANNFINSYAAIKILEYVRRIDFGKLNLLKLHLRQFASCSFTRVATDRLMWAHYSQSYQGFCVAYSFKDEDCLQTVIYRDKYPILKINENTIGFGNDEFDFQIEELIREWIKEDNIDTIKKLINFLGSIKSQEWVYEQEERIIENIKEGKNGAKFSWDSYGANAEFIIFGNRFNHKDKNKEILQILNSWNLDRTKLFEISTKSLQNFDLTIAKLDSNTINKYY